MTWGNLSGYVAPPHDIQYLVSNGISFTGTYTRQTDSLNVTIEPEEARNAGAQWRVDGGSWHNSDYTESGLSVGQHTIEFKSISGWNTPSDQSYV